MTDTRELSGRELDRRVAELRGWTYNPTEAPYASGSCSPTGAWSPPDGAWDDFYREPPQYSTDDALAAGLRREMAVSVSVQLQLNGERSCLLWHTDEGQSWAWGDTEAQATARAYVKWREAQ